MIAKKYLVDNYDCSEYLSDYENGFSRERYSGQSIFPYDHISIDAKHQHLLIGKNAVKEIVYCYRFQKEAIWAFYLSDERYEKVADSIKELINGWTLGEIS